MPPPVCCPNKRTTYASIALKPTCSRAIPASGRSSAVTPDIATFTSPEHEDPPINQRAYTSRRDMG